MNFPDWSTFRQFLVVERHLKRPDKTLYCYRSAVAYFTNRPFDRVHVREYVAYLKTTCVKDATINKHILCCKHLAEYFELPFMQSYRLFTEEPPDKIKYIFTNRQITQIIAYNGKPIYKAIFATYAYTGMRPTELCQLQVSEYDGAYLHIHRGKTGRRDVPIPHQLNIILDTYIVQCRPIDLLFPISDKQQRIELKKRCKALEIPDCSLYSFRYTSINGELDNGADIETVANIHGHSINTLLKHYRKRDLKKARDTIEATHPLLKAKNRNIDSIKRIILERCRDLIDESKFDLIIELVPKSGRIRKLYLS